MKNFLVTQKSLMVALAVTSTLVALIVTAVFPFGSLSFSLGKEAQLIATAISGPVSYFLWKDKRSTGRFFVMHFISTIVLGRVIELLIVVSAISIYGF